MFQRTVFIADDFDLPETMQEVASRLSVQGIKVIRGPKTIKGKKLEYPKEMYQSFLVKQM